MKREYKVKRFPTRDCVDFSIMPVAPIDHFAWREAGGPESFGQVAFVPGDAFYVKLSCCEAAPTARYRGKSAPVCLDSALEFFVDFAGDGEQYLNLEMNSAGALLAQFGRDRANRRDVSDLFEVRATREGAFWCVYTSIAETCIGELLGVPRWAPGPRFRFSGNFYKCGDETPTPHYGMWNPVESEIPDFHRPECFGTLRIEE